ncbi:MAG TPA: sugar phosphate isomerase/epimerase [Planctomycetota bacterium]|jgi:sugar phosphate isomerase/epimerase
MKLGFFTAILPDLSFEEVVQFAEANGFRCLEVACWPKMKADRRYAGITHIDVDELGDADVQEIKEWTENSEVEISALGYYPNPLCADEAEAAKAIDHIRKMISAAQKLGLSNVNTFVGRDPSKSMDDNWKVFDKRWPAIIEHAEKCGVKVGIENCPMLFSGDEWPGGKNMAISPKIWREMFRRIPSKNFGLNYDPSHAVWQMMDSPAHIREFADRIFHVHAKDARVLHERINDVGILSSPLEFHEPKLPGLGDVPWGRFFAALTDIRYHGGVCIEVEDRAYEGSVADRKRALLQSKRFLESYC